MDKLIDEITDNFKQLSHFSYSNEYLCFDPALTYIQPSDDEVTVILPNFVEIPVDQPLLIHNIKQDLSRTFSHSDSDYSMHYFLQ